MNHRPLGYEPRRTQSSDANLPRRPAISDLQQDAPTETDRVGSASRTVPAQGGVPPDDAADGGRTYSDQELLEISLVPVPSNP